MSLFWADALTSKQALLFSLLHRELTRRGHELLITCREYDYVVKLLRLKGITPKVIGKYGGSALSSKLGASLKRELVLVRELSDLKPSAHVSFTSPEGSRAAFKMQIPILLLTDSPHSVYVNSLTIPLANTVIVPEATPPEEYGPYFRLVRFRVFKGVFEAMWAKRLMPSKALLDSLGLEPFTYVVFRTEESKASYYPLRGHRAPTAITPLVRMVVEEGLKAVVFARYPDQEKALEAEFKGRILIPRDAVDGLSLAYYALAVVSGGSTMATEAALVGTPGITLFPKEIHIVKYLSKKGFPLYNLRMEEASNKLKDIIDKGEGSKVDTTDKLATLEDPMEAIIRTLEEVAT